MADSPDVIRRPPDAEGPIWELPFADDSFDHVVCPNVVHHVRDQASMISEWERVLKPGGTGFLFEALVRELHQVPDDYLRYTPFGMKAELEKRGLDVVWWKPTTDVFDVIRYCFLQAFQNFPSDRSADTEEWVRNEVFPRLSRWSEEYPSNLKNPAKSFPTGFLLEFRKPESLETT
jgi:ubiquinone/menaquinone biosynthesis C-methylase UbiE